MNRDVFQRRYGADWRRFEQMLEALEGRGPRIKFEAFPQLYRQICHQLALVRCRRYGPDLETHLNRLALRGHQQLYRTRKPSLDRLLSFFGSELPRLVRSESRLFWLAALLLYGPLFGMMAAAWIEPELIYTVLDPESAAQIDAMYSTGMDAEREARSDFLMFGFYIYNNISIAFRTFASGILFGIGSVFFLVYNGLHLGAVAGYINHAGHTDTFYPFVIAHGAFELTAIVLSGATGLRLGLSLVAPGRRTRVEALRHTAHKSIAIVYGIAALLVLAAFVEAFWSSSVSVDPAVRYGVGAATWVAVAVYFLFAGRRRGP